MAEHNWPAEAREWIKDCEWGDIDCEEDVDALTDDEVMEGVRRHYVGGIDQFQQDGDPD